MHSLETKCYNLLSDTSINEEDRIEAVEAYVRENSDLAGPDLERLILDILWAHRQGKTVKKKPVSTVDSKSINLPEKPKGKIKWQAVDLAEVPDKPQTEESPYDMLQRIFGASTTPEDIDRLLSHNDFDIGRTVDMLLKASRDQEEEDEKLLLTSQTAQRVTCKYFLEGSCLRGNDCLYAHDMSRKICRFWLQGGCLAGPSCLFLHEVPDEVVQKLKPTKTAVKAPPLLNAASLPTLGSKKGKSGPKPRSSLLERQEKFDLAAITANLPPVKPINTGVVPPRPPMRVPWKNPDHGNNARYVELRVSARKNAESRNKYLQLATDSWANNDPAAAKILSKKGQAFSERMNSDYREAAELLWEYSKEPMSEIFIDLHGLELGAAIDHLEATLIEIEQQQKHNPRVAYVISGRGHYKVKRFADQLTQHVKMFLDKNGYIYRDFGEDTSYGHIIGVDPWSSLKKSA